MHCLKLADSIGEICKNYYICYDTLNLLKKQLSTLHKLKLKKQNHEKNNFDLCFSNFRNGN